MSTEKPKYLFTVTTFDANPDRVATPLVLASFPPVGELLGKFLEAGGRIGLCPPCAKTHGVTDDNRLPRSEWMGAAAMLAAGEGRQAFSF